MTDEERQQLTMPQTLRDAAENLLIAIGMGWDIEGCVENLRAVLTQSDAEPDPNFPDPNFDPVEAAQVDARSIDEASKRLEVQSNAEPVTWQWRAKYKYPEGWSKWTETSEEVAKRIGSQDQCEWRALYAGPPRPDASAELIKVAEIAEERAAQTEGAAQFALQNIATEIRIRAANRSGK